MTGRVLITGAEGFTGRYLAAEMASAGYTVCGLTRTMPEAPIPHVEALYACDLFDNGGLQRIIKEVQPNVVAHLAAITFVAHDKVEEIYRTNLIGSRNLLEVLKNTHVPLQAALLVSSAQVYGNASGILDESTPLHPTNDYAVSKLAMEYMAGLYASHLPIVITRSFNYTGVGQAEQFLLPKIVSHIRRRAPFIELGNLDVARDFSDVRSVVRYYRLLLENAHTRGKIYNVCCGIAYSLNEILHMLESLSGHSIDVRTNPAFVRENEVKKLVGSTIALHAAVGKIPDIKLIDTLQWMLELL